VKQSDKRIFRLRKGLRRQPPRVILHPQHAKPRLNHTDRAAMPQGRLDRCGPTLGFPASVCAAVKTEAAPS